MNTHFLYLIIDAVCLLSTVMFSFHSKINFHKLFKPFFKSCFCVAVFFILWDLAFTKLGVWSFNSKYLAGIYFFNLPIEEVLFFFCIPYPCVFTYHCIKTFIKKNKSSKIGNYFNYALIIGLLIIAILNPTKIYTSITFLLTALVILFATKQQPNYLYHFYTSFSIILLPFFISNGILTGSFTDEAVVIYNNTYNLGFRLFTIPFEDVFYGLLLILLNVLLFEKFQESPQKISTIS